MGGAGRASVHREGGKKTKPGVYFFHTDQVGAPQAVTAIDGTITWSAEWEPFGSVAIGQSKLTSHLRFPGQYFDEETGLHYNYYRHYDPTTGRYIESDPIGLLGGLNTYCYSGGNPLTGNDPFGLCWSTARAGAHFMARGGDVSLSHTGCVKEVSDATKGARDGWKSQVQKEAEAAARAISCPNGGTKNIYLSKSVGVDVKPYVWWIGGLALLNKAECTVSKDCKKCTWSFSCKLTNNMNDEFVDPFDWDNSNSDFWDGWNFGKPFYVRHTWNDSISGSGTI